LIRESSDQRDLLLGEAAHLFPVQRERTDRHPLPHERHAEHRAHADTLHGLRECVLGVGPDIEDVDYVALRERPADEGPASAARGSLVDEPQCFRRMAVGAHPSKDAAVRSPDVGHLRATEPRRALSEGVEHRL